MDKQLMIDVNKCKYRDSYTNFCLAEKDDIGETYTICTGTDCYFKRLARKTQECEELKAYAQRQENQREEYYKEFLKKDKALEEIEEAAFCLKGFNFGYDELGIGDEIIAYADEILNIINKAKDCK